MFAVWHKVAAIMILSWAVIDICVPNLCAADSRVDLPETVSSNVGNTASLKATNPPTQDERGNSIAEDDCFCCSSHVAPAPHFALSESVTATPADLFAAETHTDDWTPFLYHPPRS